MPLTAADLVRFNTRELLGALRRSCVTDVDIERVNVDRAYALLPPLDGYQDKATYYERAAIDPRSLGYMETDVTIAQLKAELAKRPHVPTKAEGRRQRQEKAQQGRTRGRRDR